MRPQHADRQGSSGSDVGSTSAINVYTTPLVACVGNPTAGWAQQARSAHPGVVANMAPGDPGAATLNVRVNTL